MWPDARRSQIKSLTKKSFLNASHALVTYRGGHRVIEEALDRAGLSRRIALRVPHFTVVPMVLERTDLILTLPARVARVFERQGKLKSLPPPVPIPPGGVAVHWHERFEPGQPLAARPMVELSRVKGGPFFVKGLPLFFTFFFDLVTIRALCAATAQSRR